MRLKYCPPKQLSITGKKPKSNCMLSTFASTFVEEFEGRCCEHGWRWSEPRRPTYILRLCGDKKWIVIEHLFVKGVSSKPKVRDFQWQRLKWYEGKKAFTCIICNKSFCNNYGLNRHWTSKLKTLTKSCARGKKLEMD